MRDARRRFDRVRLAALVMASAVAAAGCSAPSAPTLSAPTSSASSLASEPGVVETRLDLVWRVDHGIGQPTGVALRSDGKLLVVDWGSGGIIEISADGSSVAPWGQTTGDGGLSHPGGIGLDATGSLFVADHDNDRVARFSPTGALELAWGAGGTSRGAFQAPDVIAIGPDDLVYVSEDANHRVQVFDRDGVLVRIIEAPGADAFVDPTGLAFGNGELYVADYGASRIWVFDVAGTYLRSIGRRGDGPGELDGLSMIATDAAGNVVATDYEHGRVQVFAPTGRHVATYVLEDGSAFSRPWGLVIGPDGDLYVSEYLAGRVERLRIRS